jgi:hypothetical protein
MDEMDKIIKDLSNKIYGMELDQSKPDTFSRNQFRINRNPSTQQRKVKNEDKRIQSLFKIETFMQRDDMQNYEGLEEDLNNLIDDNQEPHLTRQDYEKSLDLEPMFNNEKRINNLGESAYQEIVDSIMAKLQQKYNSRTRNQANEAVVTKQLVETQVAQTKIVETRPTQTKKTENIEAQPPTREIEKKTGGFSLENKLNKIKITMRLVDLAKNPIYKKQIAKMINFSDVECHIDVINL